MSRQLNTGCEINEPTMRGSEERKTNLSVSKAEVHGPPPARQDTSALARYNKTDRRQREKIIFTINMF